MSTSFSQGLFPFYRKVTLTDAEIKTLPTTPVTILPAPGAGISYIPIWARYTLDSTAGAYTVTPADGVFMDCGMKFGSGGTWIHTPLFNDSTQNPAAGQVPTTGYATGQTSLTDFFGTAHKAIWQPICSQGGYMDSFNQSDGVLTYLTAAAGVYALAVVFEVAEATGNMTGGNAANSLIIELAYMEL